MAVTSLRDLLRALWCRLVEGRERKSGTAGEWEMFSTKRELVNAKFEGYKLDPLEQQNHVLAFDIDRRVSQAAVALAASSSSSRARTHLHFEEVRSRIRHNHLYPGLARQALYFDEDSGVNIVRLDGQARLLFRYFQRLILCSDTPVVRRVCELPVAMDTDQATASAFKEYPSAVPLTADLWFVSDGTGRAYILYEAATQNHLIASYEFESYPFMIWASDLPQSLTSTEAHFLISTTHRSKSKPPSTSKVPITHKHTYQIHAVKVPIPNTDSHVVLESVQTLRPLWSLHGYDLPLRVEYSHQHSLFLVLLLNPLRTHSTRERIHSQARRDRSLSHEQTRTSMTLQNPSMPIPQKNPNPHHPHHTPGPKPPTH